MSLLTFRRKILKLVNGLCGVHLCLCEINVGKPLLYHLLLLLLGYFSSSSSATFPPPLLLLLPLFHLNLNLSIVCEHRSFICRRRRTHLAKKVNLHLGSTIWKEGGKRRNRQTAWFNVRLDGIIEQQMRKVFSDTNLQHSNSSGGGEDDPSPWPGPPSSSLIVGQSSSSTPRLCYTNYYIWSRWRESVGEGGDTHLATMMGYEEEPQKATTTAQSRFLIEWMLYMTWWMATPLPQTKNRHN